MEYYFFNTKRAADKAASKLRKQGFSVRREKASALDKIIRGLKVKYVLKARKRRR